MKKIWRTVISLERYTPPNAPHPLCSVVLNLECGHSERRKASISIPTRVACYACNSEAQQKEYSRRQDASKN